MRAPGAGGTTQCAPAITAAASMLRAGCASCRVDSRSHTADPPAPGMCTNAWRSRIASSSLRRLETRQPVGSDAISGCDRLMLPASGAQGPDRRRRDQQKPRILVAGVDQRIEAAVDERVVTPCRSAAPARRGSPGANPAAPSNRKRFCSAMPSSMCCPSGVMPQRCALASLASRNTSCGCAVEHPRRFTHGPRLVETATSGLVVTMCAPVLERPWPRPISRGCRRTRPGWRPARPRLSPPAVPPVCR